MEVIAQLIGLGAMGFNILSYQQKTRGKVIAFQLFGGFLFCINFFLLGAIAGSLLNAVAVVRAIVFLNKEKLRADHPAWLAGFTLVYLLCYWMTFGVFGKEVTWANLLIEFLPVVGMVATTISFRLTDARSIRRYGLISSPAWLIYNVASFSIGAIVCEVLSLGSIILGMLRLDRKTPEKN